MKTLNNLKKLNSKIGVTSYFVILTVIDCSFAVNHGNIKIQHRSLSYVAINMGNSTPGTHEAHNTPLSLCQRV